MDAATRRALFGADAPPVEALPLHAGALSMRLEGTRLLALRAGGHKVWHGVAFLYRDAHWATPEPVVDATEHRVLADGFEVDVRAHVPTEPRIDLRIRIRGHEDGRVRYEGTAWPRGDIATNRTGLCLMHPMTAMGRALEVEHDDGRISRSTFPSLVPAWPPFALVRAIRHEFAAGAWAACRLEGDSFEFEDQRNNADASFKTYNRSNMMPRPYLLRANAPLVQAAELRLETAPPPRHERSPVVGLGAALHRMPRLGVGLAPEQLADAQRLLPLLHELAPIQLHLVLDTAVDAVDAEALALLVTASGAPLRVDVRDAGTGEQLALLARALQDAGVAVEAVGAFPANPVNVDAVRHAFGPVAVGGGTPYFFAQANRVEDLGPVDFMSFATSSTVHGVDDESPMAGLQSLPWLVTTLRARHPGKAVRVGPSGLAAPRSPLGRQPPSDGSRPVALARLDPRSGALYGAAWLLGHVAALAPARLQGLSVMGPGAGEGLLRDDGQMLRPCPAWFVLRELRRAVRLRVARVAPEGVAAALVLQRERGEQSLLVANLGAVPIALALESVFAGDTECIDAASWIEHAAGHAPHPWRALERTDAGRLDLPAHAIARVACG